MLSTYLPVLIMAGYITFVVYAVLFVNRVLSPRNPYANKLSPWECGMEPIRDASTGHFRIHFFVIAILFIVFDVETLFLFPWAVIITDETISVLVFVEMFVFIGILAAGLVYAWGKGALDWIK